MTTVLLSSVGLEGESFRCEITCRRGVEQTSSRCVMPGDGRNEDVEVPKEVEGVESTQLAGVETGPISWCNALHYYV